jgi:glycosyltransferase involved in cell wall biosynthesis
MAEHMLFIQHATADGGSCISLKALLLGLAGKGIRRTVLLTCKSKYLAEYYRECCENVIWLKMPRFPHTTGFWLRTGNPIHWFLGVKWIMGFLKAWVRLRAVVRDLSPDVVHLNSATLIPYLLPLRGYPVFIHIREWVVNGMIGIRKSVMRWLCSRFASGMIYICNDYLKQFPVKGVPYRVLYNPLMVGPTDFCDAKPGTLRAIQATKQWRAKHVGSPVILFLGGVSEIKGGHFLASEWCRLESGRCLLIVGGRIEGPRRGRLGKLGCAIKARMPIRNNAPRVRRLWHQYRCREDVCVVGFIEDPAKVMEHVDLLLVPLCEPHFARPVLEALSVGCSIMASDIGGLQDLIGAGLVDYHFRAGDGDSFRQAIKDYLSSGRKRLGKNTSGYVIGAEAYAQRFLDWVGPLATLKASSGSGIT